MKGHESMNWTKRQTQQYGLLLAVLGLLTGILGTNLVNAFNELELIIEQQAEELHLLKSGHMKTKSTQCEIVMNN